MRSMPKEFDLQGDAIRHVDKRKRGPPGTGAGGGGALGGASQLLSFAPQTGLLPLW